MTASNKLASAALAGLFSACVATASPLFAADDKAGCQGKDKAGHEKAGCSGEKAGCSGKDKKEAAGCSGKDGDKAHCNGKDGEKAHCNSKDDKHGH